MGHPPVAGDDLLAGLEPDVSGDGVGGDGGFDGVVRPTNDGERHVADHDGLWRGSEARALDGDGGANRTVGSRPDISRSCYENGTRILVWRRKTRVSGVTVGLRERVLRQAQGRLIRATKTCVGRDEIPSRVRRRHRDGGGATAGSARTSCAAAPCRIRLPGPSSSGRPEGARGIR